MRTLLRRLAPTLHLTRITTAFGAVAAAWFVVLWTCACPDEPGTPSFRELPRWLLLLGATVNALGLFGFTVALNDVLDRRRDQILHPDRPLPSGRLSLESAVSLVVLTLATAVLGATPLGTLAVLVTLLVAGAALFFNAAGKYVPAVGLVVLGLIHAGQMATPNLNLRFVLPVWLVMTHALIVGGAAHTLGQKTPVISSRAKALAILGWCFWSGVMLSVGWFRCRSDGGLFPNWVNPRVYAAPLALSAALAAIIAWRVKSHGRSPATGDFISRAGALFLALNCSGILLAQGFTNESLLLGAVAALGLLGMTILREAYLLVEQPLAYRR